MLNEKFVDNVDDVEYIFLTQIYFIYKKSLKLTFQIVFF